MKLLPQHLALLLALTATGSATGLYQNEMLSHRDIQISPGPPNALRRRTGDPGMTQFQRRGGCLGKACGGSSSSKQSMAGQTTRGPGLTRGSPGGQQGGGGGRGGGPRGGLRSSSPPRVPGPLPFSRSSSESSLTRNRESRDRDRGWSRSSSSLGIASSESTSSQDLGGFPHLY